MRTIILLLAFIILGMAAYNTTMAVNMAYICANNFQSVTDINNWTCKYCKFYNLTNTKTYNNSILNIFGYSGYSPSDNAVVVTFRSTVNVQNWIADLDATQVPFPGCSGCSVHQGFYNAYASVGGYVRTDVQKLLSIYRDAKIFVTGYSLGAALATIASADLHAVFGHIQQLYTYGGPRVGNEQFANLITQISPERYRVIHYADIVPHLPPQIPIPYSHFSNEIWYDANMSKYKQCGAEQFRCSKSVLPTSWSTGDHDIKYYISIKA